MLNSILAVIVAVIAGMITTVLMESMETEEWNRGFITCLATYVTYDIILAILNF